MTLTNDLQHMFFLKVDKEESNNTNFNSNPDCQEFLMVYPAYYEKTGYEPPWIGYFVANENNELIGCGGFKGAPKENQVEIAYGVFPKYEGNGVGTNICSHLILIAYEHQKNVKIIAKTLPEHNASTRILNKNGFVLLGNIHDEEDGNVWLWERK